jgi:hypothetical protein
MCQVEASTCPTVWRADRPAPADHQEWTQPAIDINSERNFEVTDKSRTKEDGI